VKDPNVKTPLRILLLEDDTSDAGLIQDVLEADNFACDVIRTQTRAEFLAALDDDTIDLILADYTLPSFDGLSALMLASSARSDLPFIIVSGTLGEEVAIEALKIGAADYVQKTGMSRLVRSVQRALREARVRAERKMVSEAARRQHEVVKVKTPLRILLLEDDLQDAKLIQDLLETDHFVCEITCVQTRAEFLAALKSGGIDLILADYQLPSFDGISALELARSERHDLPFIFVSGMIGEEAAIDALRIGATDYILKPRIARLVPAVQRALREARERAERTVAAEAARRSEKELLDVIEAIPTMAFTALADGSSVWVNRRWVEYSGLSVEDTSESGWQATLHPDDLDGHMTKWQHSLDSAELFENEARHRSANGEYRWFLVRAVPLRDEQGKIRKWYGTLTDIEDRKRAEQERERLRQLEADLAYMNRLSMMGELAASLAHEITQPIAAARNNARAALNFLDRQPPEVGEVREALGCVVDDADRAGNIIDRIRDHIKKAPPRKHRFDLNEAIQEVIVLAQSAIAENGVSVQTRLTEGPAPVEGDRVQLQQVVLNLILNAAEAMRAVNEGVRELLISTEQSRTNGVLVAVRDSGPGIDPAHIERVFDAFYTTKSSGMGMGLSICRSIIEAHGGRLWATRCEPRGALFQFTIPAD
jgi:PAS domain S-box-containing protein